MNCSDWSTRPQSQPECPRRRRNDQTSPAMPVTATALPIPSFLGIPTLFDRHCGRHAGALGIGEPEDRGTRSDPSDPRTRPPPDPTRSEREKPRFGSFGGIRQAHRSTHTTASIFASIYEMRHAPNFASTLDESRRQLATIPDGFQQPINRGPRDGQQLRPRMVIQPFLIKFVMVFQFR